MTASIRHIAIDGSTVTITTDAALTAPATSAGRYTIDGIVREVTTQPAGFFDLLVASEGLRATEEYQYRGGSLRIGQAFHPDPVIATERLDRTAVWESAGTSLALTASDLSTERLIGVLDRFRLRAAPEGLAVTPRRSSVTWYDAPLLVKELPGIGLCEVYPLSGDIAAGLPSWPGTPAGGGELYQDQLAPNAPYVVLITETARVNVLPDEGGIEAATEGAGALRVDWARP